LRTSAYQLHTRVAPVLGIEAQRVPPSTPSRKLWKRPEFNSLQRMEGGRASGCGYSRIALRLSVIGQRVLRLSPTVPLITRSLDVARPSANAV
jgi:hypothetical protein